MAFLAQINLAEASPADGAELLPAEGLVSFFYDFYKGGWGFDPADRESFLVVYTRPGEALVRRPAPTGAMGEDSDDTSFTPCALKFRRFSSVPSLAAIMEQNASLLATDEDDHELAAEIWGPQGEDGTMLNQMLGHPYPVQNPDIEVQAAAVTRGVYLGGDRPIDPDKVAAAEADAENWVLLLQLDTDDRPGWMWGDMGMLYFLIRKDALAARDFSKAWCILQCG